MTACKLATIVLCRKRFVSCKDYQILH